MADNKVNSGLLEFSEDQKVFVALDAETSEVKKAVTIDGDGVETDITGVDVTVESLSVTENGTYSEEGKAYSPVVVNVDNKYKTANVVINWSDLGSSELSFTDCPSIVENIFQDDGTELISGSVAAENSPVTIKVPLFDAGCFWEHSTSGWQVTGDIEIIEGEGFLITGDGALTFVAL